MAALLRRCRAALTVALELMQTLELDQTRGLVVDLLLLVDGRGDCLDHLFLVVLRKGSHGVLLLLLFKLSCSSAIMVITVGGRQLKGRYEFRKGKREKEKRP